METRDFQHAIMFYEYLLMYLLDFLDFWIFNHAMIKNINKICKLICSINLVYNKSSNNKTEGSGLFINSCYLFNHLMDFLDSWIFEVALDSSIKYVDWYIMHIFDNYSHEYKNRRIFELWIKSCYSPLVGM